MVELDPHERAILAEFRHRETPDSEIAERSWLELQERITEPARIDPDHPDELLAAMPGSSVAVMVLHWAKAAAISVGLAAAALAIIYFGVRGYRAWVVEDARGHVEAVDRAVVGRQGGAIRPRERESAVRRGEASVQPVAEEVPLGIIEVEAFGDPARVAPFAKTKRRGKADTSRSQIVAELELLARAKRTTEASARLLLLGEHATRFPHSQFSDERRVLEAEALCAVGRRSEARTRVQSFLHDRPRSAYGARMRQVCTDTTD